jgi:hypothetical protein
MADFDVAAVGLSVPPPSASITPYRPAISVKNNGIHSALAFGSLRIYKAGSLVFSSDVFSATIPAGETRLAQAEQYWTPDSIGTYNVQGYVSCFNDQVEPNNNLSPVTVIVGSTPPPPPPIVTAHASQHEEGGLDELSIDGLSGKAKDKQEAFDHRSNHEAAGSDELDVTLLKGELADPQTPIAHNNDRHSEAFTTVDAVIDRIGIHNEDVTAHPSLISSGSRSGIITDARLTNPLIGQSEVNLLSVPYSFEANPDPGIAFVQPGSVLEFELDANLNADLARDYAIILLSWTTGNNTSQVMGLQWHLRVLPEVLNNPLLIRGSIVLSGVPAFTCYAALVLRIIGWQPALAPSSVIEVNTRTYGFPAPSQAALDGMFSLSMVCQTDTVSLDNMVAWSRVGSNGALLYQPPA